MIDRRRFLSAAWTAVVVSATGQLCLPSAAETFYGEPVVLGGRHIYFTSWKYVRPGQFAWQLAPKPDAGAADSDEGAWLQGDRGAAARFQLIDMPRGIRLVAERGRKVPFQPGQIAATLFDDGKYKAWYTLDPCDDPEPLSSKDKILPGHNQHVCYAESADGLHWQRPDLGLFEYAGSRANNIVFRGDLDGSTRGWHGGSVFVDPSSRDEHYKMVYLGIITDQEWERFAAKYPGQADTMARRHAVGGYRCVVALFGAVSPDGLHWQSLAEPLMIQHADTLNTCSYDLELKKYVAYVRMWQVGRQAPGYAELAADSWIGVGRRSIGRAESDDFRHFDKPRIAFATGADQASSHVWYLNGKTTLPGCPDQHVMFPWLWEMESDGGSVWLLSSADGSFWSKVPGGPVVEVGAPGSPDGGHVACTGNLLEYPGDRWCIAYGGSPIPHKYPGRDLAKRKGLFPGLAGVSGLATWPRGRLVALQCAEEGQFATVAVVPPAGRIRLNAVVKPTGYIQVAVRLLGKGDVPGRSFDQTDRLVGDDLAMPVSWSGEADLRHGGAAVILRFRLRQAKLYGIEFY